jgi:hypothetical protein
MNHPTSSVGPPAHPAYCGLTRHEQVASGRQATDSGTLSPCSVCSLNHRILPERAATCAHAYHGDTEAACDVSGGPRHEHLFHVRTSRTCDTVQSARHLPNCLFTHQRLCSILLGPGFVILYKVGRTSWTGDQPVARPLPTHRHPCLECDLNP